MDIKRLFSKSFLTMTVVFVVIISASIETDIFLPTFPRLVDFFSATESKIQLLITVNFLGLAIASFFYGPLADAYGRRPILLIGMFIFAVSSIACTITNSLEIMLVWRFLQGLGCGVAVVIPATIIHDSFNRVKIAKILGIFGSISNFVLAFAPIIGNYLYLTFSWHANFIFVAVLAVISFLYSLIFLRETLHKEHRILMHPPTIIEGYKKLLTSSKAMSYLFLSCAPFAASMVYFINLSLIFIDHLSVSKEQYGYYQSVVILVFAVMSFYSGKVIDKLGVDRTRNLGSFISTIGAVLLLCVAIWAEKNPILITAATTIFAGGLALNLGIYAVEYLNVFPRIKGIAEALGASIGLFMIVILSAIAGVFFNGTIMPVAVIIFLTGISSFIVVHGFLPRLER